MTDWKTESMKRAAAAAILPGAAFAMLALASPLQAQSADDEAWAELSDCTDDTDDINVELFIVDHPASPHVAAAQACLARLRNGGSGDDEPDAQPDPDTGVADLLADCERHFAANRLLTGDGGTAHACYREVQSRDPGNAEADAGLRRIADKYAGWARREVERGNLGKAGTYLGRLETVNGGDPRIPEIRAAIQAARDSGRTAAVPAADDRNGLDRLSRLLGRDFLPSRRDANGWTDLHYAAALDLPGLARRLIDAGANPNAPLLTDSQPLDDQLRGRLAALGIDSISGWTRMRQTPLAVAAFAGSRRAAEVLIARGASVEASDNDGHRPLHYAARGRANDLIGLLAGNGASVNAVTRKLRSPLHFGTASTETLAALLANGANIEARDEKKRTPLHFASMGDHADSVSFLLGRGARLEARDYKNRTPLFEAAKYNAMRSARVLLDRGASPRSPAFLGQTPVSVAKTYKHDRMAELLQRY